MVNDEIAHRADLAALDQIAEHAETGAPALHICGLRQIVDRDFVIKIDALEIDAAELAGKRLAPLLEIDVIDHLLPETLRLFIRGTDDGRNAGEDLDRIR